MLTCTHPHICKGILTVSLYFSDTFQPIAIAEDTSCQYPHSRNKFYAYIFKSIIFAIQSNLCLCMTCTYAFLQMYTHINLHTHTHTHEQTFKTSVALQYL
uniref:C2H2-type domain-containing protein n=1 Tax=Octopus bimaculoides TaxID=37653 RepID=A0A0L8FUS4_OCTBM